MKTQGLDTSKMFVSYRGQCLFGIWVSVIRQRWPDYISAQARGSSESKNQFIKLFFWT